MDVIFETTICENIGFAYLNVSVSALVAEIYAETFLLAAILKWPPYIPPTRSEVVKNGFGLAMHDIYRLYKNSS